MPPQTTSKLPITIVAFCVIFGAIFGYILSRGEGLSFSRYSSPSPAPPKRVGVVQQWKVLDRLYTGFQKGMADAGYVEGKDVVYDYQSWEQNPANIEGIVRRHTEGNVDLIYVAGANPGPVLSALKLTQEADMAIPIVFAFQDRPDETGVASSFKSSGNNATGIAANFAELVPKQLEFLRRLSPYIKKIGIFSDGFYVSAGPGKLIITTLKEHASRFGFTIVEYTSDAKPGSELSRDFNRIAAAIKKGDIDALMHVAAHFLTDQQLREVDIAKRLNIPTFMPILEEVEEGGLFSYSADLFAVGEQAAGIADKIFKGTKPADIPIEFPNKNILSFNLKTAREAGITIPESLLVISEIKIDEVRVDTPL